MGNFNVTGHKLRNKACN